MIYPSIHPSIDRSIKLTSKADQIDGHGSKMEVYWCQLFAASTEILPHDACMTSISDECKPEKKNNGCTCKPDVSPLYGEAKPVKFTV